jgi:zinc transport system ATP-binding protein
VTDPVLEYRNADIGYDGRAVVHHLDLAISAGEVVGLLGANGSGKSTTIRGLLGLAAVLHGEVRVFGVPRDRFRDWQRVGYVPQRQSVAGGIPATVEEVVASGRLSRLRLGRRRTPDDRTAVRDAIEDVGLSDRRREPVTRLSGGQQRRVLIARALATRPDLLVLDEPTAGVDRENQAALAHTLEGLVAGGLTIVLITHELGPVEPLVTRAVVLRDGEVVHDGPAERHDFHHEHDDEWHHAHGDHVEPGPDLGPHPVIGGG